MKSFLEKLRIQDLSSYEILDSGEDADFNHLVELASQIHDCPIAGITFLDDRRQWLKAKRGIHITELNRELTICTYTIMQDNVLVVKDTHADHRFANNPLVVQPPGIRFYAGAPIVTKAGFRIGSVCILDTKPRDFSEQKAKALEAISKQVSQLLELRLQNKMLKLKSERSFHQQIELLHDTVKKQEEKNFQASTELHENIAQELAATRMYLDLASFGPGNPVIEKSKDNLGRLIEMTKGLSAKMFPSTFPTISLSSLIDGLCSRFSEESGISVQVTQNNPEKIGREQRIILFRILEEHFRNIEQHSRASKVYVDIEVKERIELYVFDNGIGFNASNARQGYGINKMLSLTEYYGGSLEFTCPEVGGCVLQINMPVASGE